jgi:hypothetical protein
MKASTLLCIGLLATTTAALAQQRLQPGLWEQSMVMQNDKVNQAMAQCSSRWPPCRPKNASARSAALPRAPAGDAGPVARGHGIGRRQPRTAADPDVGQRQELRRRLQA